jgi:hypothetical protein
MFTKTLDGFIFTPSHKRDKKYDVFDAKTNKYITSFGSLSYQHYKDKIGYYSKLNHLDKNRKRLYYQRHGKTNDKTSAKYFANKYLW